MDFGCEHVGGGCATVAGEVDSVAAHSEAYLMWGFLFWSKICTDAAVSDVFMAVGRGMMFWDENDGIRAMDCIRNTLCQTAEFFTIGLLPNGAVLGVFDEVSVFHEFVCVFI